MSAVGSASVADVRLWIGNAKNNLLIENEKGAEAEVVLPGYAAGINESGKVHSRSKLQSSADRLSAKLEEIYCSTSSPSSTSSPTSSPDPKEESDPLSAIGSSSSVYTYHCQEEEETWTYRCRCNFQIVRVGRSGAPMVYRYAMRSMGKPVLLGTKNTFPIATRRIQAAMKGFMEHLNRNETNEKDIHGSSDLIGHDGHLTSCTFSSAWSDNPDADCVLTLYYDHPLDRDEDSKNFWKRQAQLLCQTLRLRQINGRSKGTLLSVRGEDTNKNADGDEASEATVRDTIFLLKNGGEVDTGNGCDATKYKWGVSLVNEAVSSDTNSTAVIPVHYDKPETAFYHPNRNAMTTALAWILNRLSWIASSTSSSAASPTMRKLNLLEMYCGCGAHTVALGRSGLVSRILAVELDQRLVSACAVNIAKNSLRDCVEVRRGDAGRWAKEESRKRRSRRRRKSQGHNSEEHHGTEDEDSYDVLLVDPPRQGLDEEVCKMAMMTVDGEVDGTGKSCFRNILYVSCGHFALLRDLERLSPVYEAVSCAQMDLFPRTDSIETLVHLRRREL